MACDKIEDKNIKLTELVVKINIAVMLKMAHCFSVLSQKCHTCDN